MMAENVFMLKSLSPCTNFDLQFRNLVRVSAASCCNRGHKSVMIEQVEAKRQNTYRSSTRGLHQTLVGLTNKHISQGDAVADKSNGRNSRALS